MRHRDAGVCLQVSVSAVSAVDAAVYDADIVQSVSNHTSVYVRTNSLDGRGDLNKRGLKQR